MLDRCDTKVSSGEKEKHLAVRNVSLIIITRLLDVLPQFQDQIINAFQGLERIYKLRTLHIFRRSSFLKPNLHTVMNNRRIKDCITACYLRKPL